MSENEAPNQSTGQENEQLDYLKRAADACAEGDLVLGMHLYLTAYEQAAADPDVPDGMALAGLREAWHLACDLKERSLAEYIFEKLEPYLMGDEIAECASELQNLALDRLEEYGFSREDLQEMADMIAHDINTGETSVVKVESISIPHAGMFGVPGVIGQPDDDLEEAEEEAEGLEGAAFAEAEDGASQEAAEGGVWAPSEEAAEFGAAQRSSQGGERVSSAVAVREGAGTSGLGFGVAAPDDFNPYDMYRDYSIGKSYHAATNEGSGAAIFTRDEERKAAHDDFVAEQGRAGEEARAGAEAAPLAGESGATGARAVSAATSDAAAASRASEDAAAQAEPAEEGPEASDAVQPTQAAQVAEPASKEKPTQIERAGSRPTKPEPARPVPSGAFSYRSLAGYASTVSAMRDLGIGLRNDRGYKDFLAMLNERHGLDKSPAIDTLLFRAPVLEDATRFVDATIGELNLPALRMSIEEGAQGMPVLCVMTQGNHRPRMNHANNRFEAPAVLVLEDLDTWVMPQVPEGMEGIPGFVMANISRGAREAVNLIRSAVEDPDVYVLATSATDGEPDPFFWDLLEPITVIDIGNPDSGERADIWEELMRDHPSLRDIDRAALGRYSRGLSRYDIYMAAREAVEEAYKAGLVQRSFVPVTPQNIFEKLAACQPLDSDEYQALEDEVVRQFKLDLERLEDLVDDARG